MLTLENYEIMKKRYGDVASWAIWEQADSTAKSNIASMKWTQDHNILKTINTGFVFVGLNASSTHGDQNANPPKAWSSFHSGYRYSQDYKLRFALQDTYYWGSYITDIIKHYSEVDSRQVMKYLKMRPEVLEDNICTFEEELSYLGGKPVLVAMGVNAHGILDKYLGQKHTIVKVKHYSCFIGKANYRREVLDRLDSVEADLCDMRMSTNGY